MVYRQESIRDQIWLTFYKEGAMDAVALLVFMFVVFIFFMFT